MLCRSLFLSLLLIALPWSASAQPATGILFQVPFEFVAFDSEFEPGNYAMGFSVPSHGQLVNRATGKARLVQIQPGARRANDRLETLVFEKIGDLYILRAYRSGATGKGYTVPIEKKRREHVQVLISQGLQPEQVLIAASW